MTRGWLTILLVSGGLLLSACGGGSEECDKVKRYQMAVEGQRLVVPDDLDPLEPSKEMKIPDPPPPVPHAAGAGCLDQPPGTFSTGSQG